MNTLEKKPPAMAKKPTAWPPNDYVIRVFDRFSDVADHHWQTLWAAEATQGREPDPFVLPSYGAALLDSGSATPATGWTLQLLTLWDASEQRLHAACAAYIKTHSYGEYVFDWAWADAYARHGLPYYPKAVVAVPFTPVPGPRLLATDAPARQALMQALIAWGEEQQLSSLHLLFADPQDLAAAQATGLMLRHTVQFHWHNGVSGAIEGADVVEGMKDIDRVPFTSFDDFLSSLSQDKRKKIRQERRKVAQAGVRFRTLRGRDISEADWDFFYRCYERTYLEHGNAPYLTRDFFARLASSQPDNWLMFVAMNANGQNIASSLIALNPLNESDTGQKGLNSSPTVAYGRYWGALERVDCLHFEACYYQPIAWCIAHGVQRFEGGAQGEHKMARALLPVRTTSAHWLAHPAFAQAIDRYLEREAEGVAGYLSNLASRTPLKQRD
jgi:hypothetical protein